MVFFKRASNSVTTATRIQRTDPAPQNAHPSPKPVAMPLSNNKNNMTTAKSPLDLHHDDGRYIIRCEISDPKPEGPFILRNATIIATSWADLTDGEIAAPIDVLETKKPVNSIPLHAWTGTKPDGTPAEDRCLEWSTTSKPHKGERGHLTKTGSAWSKYSATECQLVARLICIEQ